ncbi:MAG TPA: hypothetical protein VIS74_07945, partial [Chthoniobacterales bacterium]
RTRRVHYISGFDPRGVRHYHQLYKGEAARQEPHLGTRLNVGARKNLGRKVGAWDISARWEDRMVATEYQFMGWDDLVRQHWDSSLWQLFRRSVPVYLKYVLLGGFNRVSEVSRGAFYTSVFPVFFLLILLVLIVGGGGLALAGIIHFGGNPLLGGAAVLALAAGIFLAGMRWGEKLGVLWILRTCVFVVTAGTRFLPELKKRTDQMAETILREQAARPVDEVLIVGHSIGTILAVSVVARMLEQSELPVSPRFKFLTLGQCIPYVSVMPTAQSLRRELGVLARDPRIPWIDVTSPPDPLCFYQVDPIRVSGVATEFNDRPKRLVLRVFKMFTAGAYSRLRLNKLRLHFQYLMASELASAYDYFRITAGPAPLEKSVSGMSGAG